ncbi:hypothetical protein EDB89DRAFT_1914145 [Lactarius sanguifluus]|nr:hypothetical protein EDB89DRAFT_1914145 [Lactarius sanguifluus]
MVKLPDLPPLDSLLDIIELSLQSWGHPYDRFLQFNSLFPVCRHYPPLPIGFNFVKPRASSAPHHIYFLASTSLLTWREVGIHARLVYLWKDTAFVRELRMSTGGASRWAPRRQAGTGTIRPSAYACAGRHPRALALRSVVQVVKLPGSQSWTLHYYGDWIPCGYFDFATCPEDTTLAIQMKVPDTETYIEAPGARAAIEECLSTTLRSWSDTFAIPRPPPGQVVGVHDLHLQEVDEDKRVVPGFEPAVLAALCARSLTTYGTQWTNSRSFLEQPRPLFATVNTYLSNATHVPLSFGPFHLFVIFEVPSSSHIRVVMRHAGLTFRRSMFDALGPVPLNFDSAPELISLVRKTRIINDEDGDNLGTNLQRQQDGKNVYTPCHKHMDRNALNLRFPDSLGPSGVLGLPRAFDIQYVRVKGILVVLF